jgi:hypothetical protein
MHGIVSMSGSFNFKVHAQLGKLYTPREHRLPFPHPGKSKSAEPFIKQKHQRGLPPTPGEQDVEAAF